MIPTVNCEWFAGHLANFLERDADETTRLGMEAHAASCLACGTLLADLHAIRTHAAHLPERAPTRDLWAGIAARIETPVVELTNGRTAPRRRLAGWQHPRLVAGLAAAGLVAITATVTHELTVRAVTVNLPARVAQALLAPTDTVSRATATAANRLPAVSPSGASTPARLVANRPSVQHTYETEIASLRLVLDRRRPQLDSATVAVVEYNLKVIDVAIAQCKQALRKDPASRFLLESLNDAMDNKVQLLRTAAALPART
jgi:hypothetical protein